MHDTILIRPFTPADLTESDQLLEVLSALTEVSDITPEKRAAMAQVLAHDPYYIFLATENDTIVGTITLLVEQKIARGGALCGHLEDVSVHTNHQGKGIGGKLITRVVEKARELGCYKAILDCNDTHVGYYEKFGFRKVENCMRIDL